MSLVAQVIAGGSAVSFNTPFEASDVETVGKRHDYSIGDTKWTELLG